MPQSQGVGQPMPVPAPYNGLNTRENFTRLAPTEARVLENMLPDEGSCKVRPGTAAHQTISGATAAPTLTTWLGATGTKLIAGASDGKVYDVSGSPSQIGTGYTNNRWFNANFNSYLFAVNGTDTPWRYDGTTFGATGFTGPTLTTLQTVAQVRNRLWFTVNNSADVYYGGIGSVTGALTAFQISQIASGGKAVAIGSWSRDAGDGADDFTVIIMSTGQVIIYQGDPATTFSLVGKYDAPALVEKGAIVKIGGELVLMTVSGPVPVTAVIAGIAFSPDALKDWGKIAPTWQSDYQRYKSNIGFNPYFDKGIAYFVFPTGTDTTRIYVYNTRIPAWTVYTNMDAGQFAALSGELYFGGYSTGNVWRHGTGADNGSSIITLSRQGAIYPANQSRSMLFNSFRPNIDADGPAQVQFGLDIDFQSGELGPIYDVSSAITGGDWGDDWGVDWASSAVSRRLWYGTRGYGRAVAPVVRTISTASNVLFWSSDIRGVMGGQL